MNYQALYHLAVYVFSAAAVILLAEAVYLTFSGMIGRRKGINHRLRMINEGVVGTEALIKLKRERGISFDGAMEIGNSLQRLIVQSGLKLTLGRLIMSVVAIGIVVSSGILLLTTISSWLAIFLGLIIGASVPMLVLKIARTTRQRTFISQLPDALDVIVRSLRSGHPVPVALNMVGKELSDPIGTEFGITVDEMTYGLEIEQALRNLNERVGHQDLSLLVTAVSLQTSTGGNLTEILGNLSKVIRDRFQLRRKVRSLSAEGRISAYGLTALPIIIFFVINFQNPAYYGDAWNEPIFIPALVVISVWSLIGDLIMYKMINFKF
jgi:tight adherence protein B